MACSGDRPQARTLRRSLLRMRRHITVRSPLHEEERETAKEPWTPRISAHRHSGAIGWRCDTRCPFLRVKGEQGRTKVRPHRLGSELLGLGRPRGLASRWLR